jgi:HEAT repeat protein
MRITDVARPVALSIPLLVAALSVAAPVPLLNIPNLVARADVVATGRITGADDVGPATLEIGASKVPARRMIGQMDVGRFAKGRADGPSIRFEYVLPEVAVGYRGVAAGSYRTVFLKSTDGNYEFVSPYHPSVIAAPIETNETDPVAMVLESIAAVVSAPASAIPAKREAIDTLLGITHPVAIGALKSGLQLPDRGAQLHAAAALLMIGDLTPMPIAEAALLKPDQRTTPEALMNLRSAISRGITSDAAIPSLRRLLASSAPDTRRAAAAALGRTKSPAAAAALARALDDDDPQVRLAGVRAFGELTGDKAMVPSDAAFREDEGRYLGYWKAWVARR